MSAEHEAPTPIVPDDPFDTGGTALEGVASGEITPAQLQVSTVLQAMALLHSFLRRVVNLGAGCLSNEDLRVMGTCRDVVIAFHGQSAVTQINQTEAL